MLSNEFYSLFPLKQSIPESDTGADGSHASLQLYKRCVQCFKGDPHTLKPFGLHCIDVFWFTNILNFAKKKGTI